MEKLSLAFSKRRAFIKQSMAGLVTSLAIPAFADTIKTTEKKPPIASDTVFEFVRVSHGNLDRVKELLDKEPRLINSSWDWGGGDFETALGASAHMGNRVIAKYLLEHGARKDIFCAAMLGENELVKSFIQSDPTIVNVKGPHEYSLLYHVAIHGDVEIAISIKPHLSDVSTECNAALHAAARDGHLPMTEWLISNGVTDMNTLDLFKRTPLQTALKNGYKEVAEFLKAKGGV